MKFFAFTMAVFAALCMSSVDVVVATPTPSMTCMSTSGSPSTSTASSNNNNTPFGIQVKSAAASTLSSKQQQQQSSSSSFHYQSHPLFVRGGELHEAESLEDVDAILLNAAANNKLVVIDFTATWCGPCKMIAPLFKEMSEEYTDVVFMKVDVDENPETAAKYSVSAMPTFLFIKSGEVIDRVMGANVQRLQELIQEHE